MSVHTIGNTMNLVGYASILFLIVMAVSISVVDIHQMIIPDSLNLSLAAGGLIASLWLPGTDLRTALIGLAVGGSSLWLFRWSYARLRGIQGIGLGDVKFLAAAGAWTGALGIPSLLFVAAVAGLVFAGVLHARGRTLAPTERLPFGPFLCLGLLCVAIPQILWERSIYDLMMPLAGLMRPVRG